MNLEPMLVGALRGALLLGAALVAMPLLRRAPAAVRRSVLAVALVGALAVPALSAVLPVWRVAPRITAPAPLGFTIAEPVVIGDPPTSTVERGTTIAKAPTPEAATNVDAAPFLFAAWAFGALMVLARLGVGLWRSRAMVRRGAPAPAWALSARRAEATTRRRADVRVTRELEAPAVTGVFAPVVLVPRASWSWSEERRYATLLHELAHVASADCLVQIVAQVACAMHWFNPLAWLAVRRLKIERELAADDAVLRAGTRASTYAEDLLAIAGALSGGRARQVPAGSLGMAEPSQLAVRVSAIVEANRPRAPLSRATRALLSGCGAAIVVATACASPQTATSPATAPTLHAAGASAAATTPAPSGGSTIDPKLQSIADVELDKAMAEWHAAAGAVLVLDPATGEILANAGRAHGARADVAVGTAYITGSTLKAVTLAAALEDGVVSPTERIDCGNGAWTYQGQLMHDASPNGTLSIAEMLAVSTNVGFTKIFDRLGGAPLENWLRAFHFGTAPAIEGAASGQLPTRIEDHSYAGAVAAIGEVVTASPVQIAAAYAAIANGGEYVAPTATKRSGTAPRERIMKPETARTMISMLESSVSDEKATGKRARVAGVRVAGKTGTAGWTLPSGGEGVYASFVGFVPANAPRYVVLVGLEQPREGGNGGSAAAPVFARVVTRALGGS